MATTDPELRDFLGNGVTNNRNGALPVGKLGTLSLYFHPKKNPQLRAELLHAFDALCAFGGFGLLGRRGLGSVSTFAVGTQSLADAITENRRMFLVMQEQQRASSIAPSSELRLINWPLQTDSPIEALAILARRLKALEITADIESNLEKLSDVLSSQANWRRAGKGGNRRPSPLSIKVQSCIHDGRPVQLITVLLLPSNYLSESIDKASALLETRLKQVLDDLDLAASSARTKLPGAFA